MSAQVIPTKGNLLKIKKSLELAQVGYELMDKKRNILIREIMLLTDKANALQDRIDDAYNEAYTALQTANITLGFCRDISMSVPEEKGLSLDYRSVMGVELPIVSIDCEKTPVLHYGLGSTNSALDNAYKEFLEVKLLTVELAEIENSIYRLAMAIKKTQKRANALGNIIIPRFKEQIAFISDALEEKEREEFSRLKLLKK